MENKKRIQRMAFQWSLIILLIIPLNTYAQRFKSFSNDPTLIPGEMRTFAETVPKERQKEAEQLLIEFDAFWNSPKMTESFENNFIKSDLSDHDRDWMRFIQYHVNNDISRFDKLMINYANIFTSNILNTTPNVRWTAYGIIEDMGMEEEPYFSFKDIDLVGASSRDSVEIIGTTGRYYPASVRWDG